MIDKWFSIFTPFVLFRLPYHPLRFFVPWSIKIAFFGWGEIFGWGEQIFCD